MFHFLLNYTDYGNGREMVQDPTLVNEIQAHLEAVFPEYLGQTVPPEVIARQFGHQILIQPSVPWGFRHAVTEEMLRQPGSVLYQIAAETGVTYDPDAYADRFEFLAAAGRDPYIYVKPDGWLSSFFGRSGVLLRTVANLVKVTGADIPGISGFYAAQRSQAYRIGDASMETNQESGNVSVPAADRVLHIDPGIQEAKQMRSAEPGDMTAVFGTLQPWDRYFLGTNINANWAFHVNNVAMIRGFEAHPSDLRYGRMFLKNLIHIDTFVTNAAYDLVVYSKAFAPSLARYTDIVTSAQRGKNRIVVSFRPDAFPGLPAVGQRTITFPAYNKSCHAVSLTEPVKFFNDVAQWMGQRGFVVD
jgi:hypothetical protein